MFQRLENFTELDKIESGRWPVNQIIVLAIPALNEFKIETKQFSSITINSVGEV